jgi:hypothetical protein
MLRAATWEAVPEATFAIGAERGSVDVLAWHAPTATVLIVEVKSVVPDAQAITVRVAPLYHPPLNA